MIARVSYNVFAVLTLPTKMTQQEPLFKHERAINQITFQTGRLVTADPLVKIRQDANVPEKHQHFHLHLSGYRKA